MKREMKNRRYKISNRLQLLFCLLLLTSCLLFSSCGYHIIGSKYLPFDSIAVRPVQNMTYEPQLKEKLHNALSSEFITQGIKIVPADRPDTSGKVPDSGIVLEARITTFELRTIAAVDEQVKEQEIIMLVDVTIMDKNTVSELKAVKSPLQITYQATGTVSEANAQKERAIDKACAEIAKEISDKIIIKYVK
jgi:outer membrane lipopolysaccharide assembly protein LptE/RlpB